MATSATGLHTTTPIPPGERIDAIDALRGVALLGVLAINLEREFRVSIFQQFLKGPALEGPDRWVDAFLRTCVDLKAFAVFSLLFGLGLAIQHERLSGHPRRAVLLVRRLLALLAFGLAHLLLIWNGDILTEYALAGLIALPFLFAPTWALVCGAALFLLLYLALPLLPPVVPFPDPAWLANHVQAATRIYGTGSFGDILMFRLNEVPALLPLHAFVFPRTVGLFLVGMLVWRAGVVRTATHHARGLWVAAALGIGFGLALALAAPAASAATIVLALGYASLVLAIASGRARHWLAWAAPVGRMAFTNYLLQSLILGCVFYGYGLGFFGKLGLSTGLGLVVLIYIAQVLFSRWWLARFRFGPVEWLWRAAMYGSRPPFKAARTTWA